MAYGIPDKGLEFKVNSELEQQKDNLIKNLAKGLNRHFFKEDIQTFNKPLKRCSTSFATREIQIKITMKGHFTPSRKAVIKIITAIIGDIMENYNPCTVLMGM